MATSMDELFSCTDWVRLGEQRRHLSAVLDGALLTAEENDALLDLLNFVDVVHHMATFGDDMTSRGERCLLVADRLNVQDVTP